MDLEFQEREIFFREWWARKVDYPSPIIIKMFKVKHLVDYIPFMKNELKGWVLLQEENIRFITAHFQNMFNDKGWGKKGHK